MDRAGVYLVVPGAAPDGNAASTNATNSTCSKPPRTKRCPSIDRCAMPRSGRRSRHVEEDMDAGWFTDPPHPCRRT